MAEILDFRGLKCPQPVFKVAVQAPKLAAGTTIEVLADCPSFPTDIEKWCKDMGKVLVSCVDRGTHVAATIQL